MKDVVAVGCLEICPHTHLKKPSADHADLVQSLLSSLSLLFHRLSTFTTSSIGPVSNHYWRKSRLSNDREVGSSNPTASSSVVGSLDDTLALKCSQGGWQCLA